MCQNKFLFLGFKREGEISNTGNISWKTLLTIDNSGYILMITKQNLTCKLKLRRPEIETGHALKSGALFTILTAKLPLVHFTQ